MLYSAADIFQRLKAILPDRWFAASTPVLDSVLQCLAAGWVQIFVLVDYVNRQTRLGTMSGPWLDAFARDFFGEKGVRRRGVDDENFRRRIQRELIRDRCTRDALYSSLVALTGRSPWIFEPANPGDTGAWAIASTGYNSCGGWGSLALPFQAFIRVYLPIPLASPMLNGWNGAIGGFGSGISAYGACTLLATGVTSDDIYQDIMRVAPAGTTIWTSIEA